METRSHMCAAKGRIRQENIRIQQPIPPARSRRFGSSKYALDAPRRWAREAAQYLIQRATSWFGFARAISGSRLLLVARNTSYSKCAAMLAGRNGRPMDRSWLSLRLAAITVSFQSMTRVRIACDFFRRAWIVTWRRAGRQTASELLSFGCSI